MAVRAIALVWYWPQSASHFALGNPRYWVALARDSGADSALGTTGLAMGMAISLSPTADYLGCAGLAG